MNRQRLKHGDSPDGTLEGYFVIADISGYTGFLTNNELAHAQGILAELSDLLIDKLAAPFRFVELEGDAVFVFAPDDAVEDAERLVDIIEACYAAFRIRLEQMATNTSCECSACRAMQGLNLKFVAHFGRYVPQKTPTGTKLVGPDVILVHRLLKNAVIEKTGIEAYALLTDAFIRRATFGEAGLGLPRHVEAYPELGVIEGRVLNLTFSLDRYREAARHYVGPEDADMEIVSELPAPRGLVWAYHLDAKRRMRWQLDTTSVENRSPSGGRTGVGWESHCDHGNYRLNHRITDWKPLDYITMDTLAKGTWISRPPDSHVTFAMQDLPDNRCKVSMRIRAIKRDIPSKLKLSLLGFVPKRQWLGHYRVLSRLLKEEMAQAEAAGLPPAPRPAEPYENTN